MANWQKVKKWTSRSIKITLVFGVLSVGSVFTPIFADVGVFALDVFSKITLPSSTHPPTATVLLGGGLTKKNGEIALNHYSQSRADIVIKYHYDLPIITSGTESPWLQDYIKSALPDTVVISDNASMNTCENAIFTAKLLSHHELTDSVYLVTDRYHMARARRQFAKAGIATTPQPAPLAINQSWSNLRDNLVHSRRTVYEMVALARDIFRPQTNCRGADEISLGEISTPRREPKIFSENGDG